MVVHVIYNLRRIDAKDGDLPLVGVFLIIHKAANKNLDREKQFNYIHIMFTPTLVILKVGHKAAWQHIAVAKGRFY